MPHPLLQSVTNNTPGAKPELWRNLPFSLVRNLQCRISGTKRQQIVELGEGGRIRVDLSTGIGTSIYIYRCWEYPVTELLASLLEPGMCCLDVGANIGYYSIMAGARGASVHCFEPVPHLYEKLRENIALNPAAQISAYRLALAEESGSASFFVVHDASNLGLSSLEASAGAEEISVETKTLDDLVREQGINRVDLIKVDVEGAEERVFQGAAGLLKSDSAPDIIFECHPWATCDRILKTFGYRVYEFRRQRTYEARNLFASKRELPSRISTLLQ